MAKKTKAVKEKKYKDFDAMIKGHKVLTYQELKDLNEPKLDAFLEEEEWSGGVEGGFIEGCIDSGRLVEKVLAKHNLHVITMSIFDHDEEEDADEEGEEAPTPCTYSYVTGFHWVNRERYYLCQKKTAAFCEETIDF
jgi:hypothetical protein